MTEQLELAVKTGRVDVVKSFLSTLQESKENDELLFQILKEPCFNGETLLHLSSRLDQFDIVRTLLAAGSDPTVVDKDGKLAYAVSASEKTKSVYRECLLQAASQSKTDLMEQLIKSGVPVNFTDTPESLNTPLHWAASFADENIVEILCGHGADVLAVNSAGCSPLHEAVSRGNHHIVQCLLKYGADPALQISQGPNLIEKFAGMTCFELAENKPDILSILNNPPPLVEIVKVETSIPEVNSQDSLVNDIKQPNLTLPNGNVPADLPPQPTLPQLMSPVFKRSPILESVRRPPQVVTEEKLSSLWPQPQSIEQHEGYPFHIRKSILPVLISIASGSAMRDIRKCWKLHRQCFEDLGINLCVEPLTPLSDLDDPNIVCCVSERLCPGKGCYKMTVMQNQIKLICNDCDSLHFAIATLLQIFRMYRDEENENEIQIPQLRIDDWPDLPYRGILFDISQGRVPNLVTFKETVLTLSMLKINQIYLYTRFRNLDQVMWQVCYGMEELLELDEFCHDYGIELCPVLEVAPTVQYDDVTQMYAMFQDFLTCFSFNRFISVGPRLSSFLLDVDEDNILSVSDCTTMLPVRADQTLQLCAYPLHDLDKNLLTQIPPHLVFNEYGVQATHNFSEICKPLSNHGMGYLVCPGTSAWNSLAGCPEAAITNVYNAVKCAASDCSLGVVVCNWSGKGHITHLPFCWPGFMMGAGLSWNSNCHWEFCVGNLEELLNLHVFRANKGVIGHAIVELGRAETYLLRCARCQSGDDCSDLPSDNGSLLYQFLLNPDNSLIENLTPDMLQRVTRHVRKCQTELKSVELSCSQGASIVEELQHTCELMLLAVKIGRALVVSGRNPSGQAGCDVVNLGISNLPPTVKTDLANKLLELLETFGKLWKQRYQEHGLKYSLSALQNIFKQFVPEGDPRLQNDAEVV